MFSILADWRIGVLGLLSWALPFAISVAFFDQSGELIVSRPLFKSLMVVLGGGIGVVLLVMALRWSRATLATGAVIGLYWLVLNLLLDLAILVPMSGMSTTAYLSDIGLRYLLLPIIGAGMGAVEHNGR